MTPVMIPVEADRMRGEELMERGETFIKQLTTVAPRVQRTDSRKLRASLSKTHAECESPITQSI